MSDTEECGRVAASCLCSLPSGHEDGLHSCECGGSWRYDADGEFEPVDWPQVVVGR